MKPISYINKEYWTYNTYTRQPSTCFAKGREARGKGQ